MAGALRPTTAQLAAERVAPPRTWILSDDGRPLPSRVRAPSVSAALEALRRFDADYYVLLSGSLAAAGHGEAAPLRMPPPLASTPARGSSATKARAAGAAGAVRSGRAQSAHGRISTHAYLGARSAAAAATGTGGGLLRDSQPAASLARARFEALRAAEPPAEKARAAASERARAHLATAPREAWENPTPASAPAAGGVRGPIGGSFAGRGGGGGGHVGASIPPTVAEAVAALREVDIATVA
ncbi:hypothetical protein T492DRAFT_889982 [Pavlovales sp. CCMP2436]|nr:hypothetical protein T492DRAFT_889982 [Pavlovales sp. CCMP2436]